ncbi:UNKNOWN [Stylonychia lemnae]|uniref:Uncharacterized protein n=1 Tax=Stylonychia lemnae TaxID=5949 RepID=A0A078B0F6_STYLE|nr:UNKNOWN [Stylonychia lemnae]|eukprot:CDW86578.1 UNKNOWN [Stylonychia lemnae]
MVKPALNRKKSNQKTNQTVFPKSKVQLTNWLFDDFKTYNQENSKNLNQTMNVDQESKIKQLQPKLVLHKKINQNQGMSLDTNEHIPLLKMKERLQKHIQRQQEETIRSEHQKQTVEMYKKQQQALQQQRIKKNQDWIDIDFEEITLQKETISSFNHKSQSKPIQITLQKQLYQPKPEKKPVQNQNNFYNINNSTIIHKNKQNPQMQQKTTTYAIIEDSLDFNDIKCTIKNKFDIKNKVFKEKSGLAKEEQIKSQKSQKDNRLNMNTIYYD